MKEKVVSIAEGKRTFTRLLREFGRGDRIIIARRNEPVAVIFSYPEYKNLKRVQDYLEMLKVSSDLETSGVTATEVYEESRKELEEKGFQHGNIG